MNYWVRVIKVFPIDNTALTAGKTAKWWGALVAHIQRELANSPVNPVSCMVTGSTPDPTTRHGDLSAVPI